MHFEGGDEASIVPFVYPRGKVSVSSLSYFSSVGSSSYPSHSSLPLSLSQGNTWESLQCVRLHQRAPEGT